MADLQALRRVVAHEWRLMARDPVVWAVLALYALLLAYGVFVGTDWKRALRANTAQAVALADKGFSDKLAKVDRILSGRDRYAFAEDPRIAAPLARFKGYEMAAKAPSPAAAIAIGQSDVMPSFLRVQWKAMFKQASADELENPRNLAIGSLDLAFVLVYLYPLLVIALAYDLLSREREQGTQSLLLSQPVSLATFVAGKVAARATVAIGLAALVPAIGLLVANPDIVTAGETWRVGLLMLLVVLYGAVWFAAAVLVNAFGRRSSTNVLVLMGAWIAFVLVIPALVNLAAKVAHPLPSRIEMVQALRRADQVAERESGFQRSYRADLLRISEEEALQASTNDFYTKVLPLEERGEQLARPVFERFAQGRRSQQAHADALKGLSPAAIVLVAMSDLADHGAASFGDFDAQVAAYHRVWRNYFLGPVRANRPLTRDEMVAIPRFGYVPEAAAVVVGRVTGGLVVLLVFGCVLGGAGVLALRRYPR